MNPYTQSLLSAIHDPHLERFVTLWDALEGLAVDIYRQGGCRPEQVVTYGQLLDELRIAYADWENILAPHWKAARVKGQPLLTQDPFLILMKVEACSDWIGNREALKILPAAREALNRYLLSVGN